MMNQNIAPRKHFILSIIILTAGFTLVAAQPFPNEREGRRIEGTWNLQIQWRTCDDGTPQLLPTPAMKSFAAGGVVTEVDSTIWCDIGHCTSLGVWKHVGGPRYSSSYKRSRVDPDSGQYTGYVIVTSSIIHQADDTLRITDSMQFYDPAGVVESTRCRTSTGTRFKGEN